MKVADQEGTKLLDRNFNFAQDSQLKKLVESKVTMDGPDFSFQNILIFLKNLILKDGLYDKRNPPIIICSQELETALNIKALHVGELKKAVLKQLVPVAGAMPSIPPWYSTSWTTAATAVDRNGYELTEKLRELIIAEIKGMNMEEKEKLNVFTMKQITEGISSYILARKEILFDPRNNLVVFAKHSLIGEALQVDAFHRCQVNALIKRQVTMVVVDSRQGRGTDTDGLQGNMNTGASNLGEQ